MELLERRKREQAAQRLKAGQLWQGWETAEKQKAPWYSPRRQGATSAPRQSTIITKTLACQIGAPESRVHDLRHTFAVLSLQNGDDVKTVQGTWDMPQRPLPWMFTAMYRSA